MKNSTISQNRATTGGGIYTASAIDMWNSIITDSTAGGDCFGSLNSNINNLIADGSCSPSVSEAPLSAPYIRDNGGATYTQALLPNNSAGDAGDLATCLPTDQRGQTHIGTCDIGAYELDNSRQETSTNITFTVPVF